jgi:hypothetical protein
MMDKWNHSIVFLLIAMVIGFFSSLQGQILSNLDATKDDALFTTYAAPQSHSSYTNDQGYQFLWNDDQNGAEFISGNGLNFGLAFRNGKEPVFRLNELYREPVVTASYSDLVSYYYYPFKDLRVEILFVVYSSQEAIADIRILNEAAFPAAVTVSPYLYFPSGDTVNDILHQGPFDFYSFPVKKPRDGWMKEHSIPLVEELQGFVAGNIRFDSILTFATGKAAFSGPNRQDPFRTLKEQFSRNKRTAVSVKGLICSRTCRIYPGDRVHFRIVFGLEDRKMRIAQNSAAVHNRPEQDHQGG